MGLRFRKSISLIPGVRLNFSKSGMSVSSGVPGFRKTINTKGQVTTTVGMNLFADLRDMMGGFCHMKRN